ncbi:UNVERIFIED_CONTAM: pSer/pThr/pTyr-binding forkhead associated (FHA) protein [Acetivibrio alkalicellulosi]
MLKDRFDFSYESGATANYLVVSCNVDEMILNYQVDMLSQNHVSNILALDVRRKDEKINLYYNITSKISLKQFLKKKKLFRNEFLKIVYDMLKVILGCKDFLLNEESFLLSDDFIYINPETMEIFLVYIPVKSQGDINYIFKDYIMNFIMYTADIDERNSDNFLQKILSYLKTDVFNILDFSKLIKDMNKKEERDNRQVEVESFDISSTEQAFINQKDTKEKVNKAIIKQRDIPAKRPLEKSKTLKNDNNTNTKTKYKTSSIIVGVILQVVLFFVAIAVFASGKLATLGEDMVVNSFAVILILGAISVLLWKNVLNKKNIIAQAKSNENKNKTLQNQNIIQKQKIEVPKKIEKPQLENTRTNEIIDDKTTLLSNYSEGDTELLDNSLKNPILLSKKNGVIEEITINKPCFKIGRVQEMVDYVSQNRAIGKVHAEIISKNARYYLKDLNSTNGSFVNGIKLESNVEKEIKNNDKIAFANDEYTFIVFDS